MYMMVRSFPFLAVAFVFGCLLNGCANYGEKLEFNGGELYYTEGVSEEEANKLGDYLVKEGYFDGEEKSVQLQKDGDHFVFRAVIQEDYMEDENIAKVFEVVGAQISQAVFNGAPVDVHLTDEYLETKKTIPFNPAAGVAETEIPMSDSTAASDADSLATAP